MNIINEEQDSAFPKASLLRGVCVIIVNAASHSKHAKLQKDIFDLLEQ